MFKDFLVKKMLRSQGATSEQADAIVKMMNKDPELFKKIAGEIKTKVDGGMDQQQAAIEVMTSYQSEIAKLTS